MINQLIDIINSTYFGSCLVFWSSLLLSSILLNSEAWVNLAENNIKILEKIDENLSSEANTSNAINYLELGLYPIRFDSPVYCKAG